VHYEIGGQQLTDYWFYVHRRWVFDLVLSNPDAVKLYRMSPSSTSRRWAVTTDSRAQAERRQRWLCGWAAGHQLAAGVLVQAVEQPQLDAARGGLVVGQQQLPGAAGVAEGGGCHVGAFGVSGRR
jgi:hypothetical protein